MSKILVLDAETYDPNLKKYGAGWVFKYHYPTYQFEVLGVGCIDYKGIEHYFDLTQEGNSQKLLTLINEHDTITCHNALYDLGCLKQLYGEELDFSNFLFIDTMLMAKLYDQHIKEKFKTKFPYALDTLANAFKLTEKKETNLLTDHAWESGLFAIYHKNKTGQNKKKRPSEKVLQEFSYSDLRIFPTSVIKEYCLQDIRATKALCEYLESRLECDYQFYSDLLLVCLDCKKNGIRIDIKKAKEIAEQFTEIRNKSELEIRKFIESKCGSEYAHMNINSVQQLAPVFIRLGYQVPTTEKGNYSIKKEWLENQSMNDILCNSLIRYRKAHKMTKDFIVKSLNYQKVIPKEYRDPDYGWLYPSIKPLGAHYTGRFTSGGGQGCLELSIHQIPRRDEEFGKPLREIFVAHEGEELICGDFNGQESRLQVHYADLLGCSGTKDIIAAWWLDPEMKYHKKVAEWTGLDYEIAKMINLALSYDMHEKTLCKRLGLGVQGGMQIIYQYHTMLPFMKQLQNITASTIARLGYVRTIGGRKLYIDPSYEWNGRLVTKERKALSKLIQGSAADQCMVAMINAAKCKLKILFSVHDEIVVSSPRAKQDLPVLKHCMENSYPLKVPVIADVNIGFSWGDAK